MLKYTEDEATICELKQAMQAMLRAIQYANDLMHEVAISGHKVLSPGYSNNNSSM